MGATKQADYEKARQLAIQEMERRGRPSKKILAILRATAFSFFVIFYACGLAYESTMVLLFNKWNASYGQFGSLAVNLAYHFAVSLAATAAFFLIVFAHAVATRRPMQKLMGAIWGLFCFVLFEGFYLVSTSPESTWMNLF